MSSLFTRSWGSEFRHPSEETLLLYLDGEVGPGRHRQITAHLQNCWACRSRRDKIEQAIGGIVDTLGSPEAAPPRAWRTFAPQLHALAAEPQESGFWGSFSAYVKPLQYAGVSVALAALVFWAYLGSPRTVSAKEFLSRAGAAETRRIQEVGNRFAYQKLRLRKTTAQSKVEQLATLELRAGGRDPALRPSGGDAVWRDVERILKTNGMDRPLSALAYERWRGSVPRSRESVERTTLEDGSEAFALDTEAAAPHRPDTIVASTLVVRASDWRPVQQNLRVQVENDVVRYDLTEVAFDVRPAALPALETAPRKLETVSPPAVTAPPAPAFAIDADGTEVQARYALHHLKACLGEPIEVSRDASGRVVVRGLAETPERKQELLASLHRIPGIAVDIRTTEEAMRSRPAAPATVPAAPQTEPPSSALPIQRQLETYFKTRAAPGSVDDQIAGLANQASLVAQSITAEAWALRRLADAYPSRRATYLQPAFQRLLREMMDDHANALRERAVECRTLVEPVLATLVPLPAPSSPAGGLPALFQTARDAERLTLTLFTGSGEPIASPEDAAARLLAALRDLEAHSTLVAQDLKRELFTGTAAKGPDANRR